MNYQKLIEIHSCISFIICVVGCENPKPCQTELTVLEYGEYDGDPVTKVLLQPLTGTVSSTIQTKYRWNTLSNGKSLNIKHPVGRTHQLRVHCSAIGHPIVGDYTYSLRTDNAPYRMMLHAYFLHIPLENEPIHVTAPDPFVPTLDSKWAPQRCVNVLEDLLKNILTKPQTEIQEEPEPVHRRSSPVESEEQQAQCQQWLCEWNLDWGTLTLFYQYNTEATLQCPQLYRVLFSLNGSG